MTGKASTAVTDRVLERRRAVALARHYRDFEGLSTEKGIKEYLILLSVCETCKFKGINFLDFLRSGKKDVHAFAEFRCGRTGRLPSNSLASRGERSD